MAISLGVYHIFRQTHMETSTEFLDQTEATACCYRVLRSQESQDMKFCTWKAIRCTLLAAATCIAVSILRKIQHEHRWNGGFLSHGGIPKSSMFEWIFPTKTAINCRSNRPNIMPDRPQPRPKALSNNWGFVPRASRHARQARPARWRRWRSAVSNASHRRIAAVKHPEIWRFSGWNG